MNTLTEADLPFVTIQLPVFNEQYVVERLIDNIVKINYPARLLQIQILDDSTDETLTYSSAKVEYYRTRGIDIELIHRTDRTGYKAGALKNGLTTAKGAFIAIFDADFLPDEDFILKCIPYFFQDERYAVVQTRWEYINRDYSLITRLQALPLNVHFSIEQTARMYAGLYLQFNGTGGIWRRKAIEDAGGWSADTLTEDLDLSIRTQLKGWKIKYIEETGTPSELPVEMNGFKSQQYRWMKGGAECARKLLPAVFKSDLPFTKKMFTTAYLLSSSVFLLVFLTALLSFPAIFLLDQTGYKLQWASVFMVGWALIFPVYLVGNFNPAVRKTFSFKDVLVFVVLFPLLLSLSLGMSLHNAIAVLDGFRGRKSAFIRTPKYNIVGKTDKLKYTTYRSNKMSFSTRMEYFMALYFVIAGTAGILYGNISFLGVQVLLFVGFFSIATLSWKHVQK
ncbi:MAG TPA: glycosyltransferase family 2 protein [Saprospiraceae bacterium]|nr:glycosyltransferase family 2 protein [Saprospiraceae bacterium]HMX82282.1 glycosyltransferase family 2 protein [Saprospiraceae bacterium]HMX85739.1 glycosyltransferase family 2 protein [Saprospiraceae bacterium]HMZ74004.1 glycosyltransferase family 2 protein [Saprospiraceae bacterium]HNA41444.1 glycosyltransferase family 2 protein [Saprospiraceae bacterium]